MTNLFDFLRFGGELNFDICKKTKKPHDYYVEEEYDKGDKHYEILRCKDCNHVSTGWKNRDI